MCGCIYFLLHKISWCFFFFNKYSGFLKKKEGKMGILKRFCSVFSSKLPDLRHISEVSFDHEFIQIIDIVNFTMENRTVFSIFLLNCPIFDKKRVKMSSWVNFRIKVMKKLVPEKTYLVKLEFYNTDRKMKSTTRRIFNSQ